MVTRVCWQKYLRWLSQDAWGDHLALAAICKLFNVKDNVFCANQADINVRTLNDCGEHEVNIGLIMQFHFIGLNKLSVLLQLKYLLVPPQYKAILHNLVMNKVIRMMIGENNEIDNSRR